MALNPIRPQIEQIKQHAAAYIPGNDPLQKQRMLDSVVDEKSLEDAAVQNMDKTYSVEELQALKDFYSTPEGKSVGQKNGEYLASFMPQIQMMVIRAALQAKQAKINAAIVR